MIELGKIAYDAYWDHRAGITHDGRKMPVWEDLGPAIRGAWSAAADAVADVVGS